MEDFGDLLYIVFAVIGVIYSIIKKNNKKAREATPPIQPMQEDEDVAEDEISTFEKLFGVEKSNAPKPAFVQPSVQTIEEKKRQMEKSFSRIKSTKVIAEVEGNEELEVERPVIDFDLRQAVIYSEVLKRPEF